MEAVDGPGDEALAAPADASVVADRWPVPALRSRFAWGALTALTVVLGYVVVLLGNRRFFYQDDTEAWAVPLWNYFGHALRSGHLPVLTPDFWMSGNWTVEGQVGLWNPAQLLIDLVAPSVDRLDLLAAGVKLAFAIVLATGVYRLALAYGARAPWAMAAGAMAPFTGFVLYYDSASWVSGLASSAWVAQAWASGVHYARGRSGPLATFAFLYLALSVGYAHGAIAAGLMVVCLLAGEALRRVGWRTLVRPALTCAAAGLCGAVTFLPGFLSAPVTWRTTGASTVLNTGLLSAPWSETLAASLPTALPAIPGFAGPVQRSPITYIGWFVLPLLAFVAWQEVFRRLRDLAGPLLFLAVMLLVTAGPSQVGAIRWPARMLPYVAIAVLVLCALLASRFVVRAPSASRLVVAGALVLANVARALSADPRHAATAALTGGAVLALVAVTAWVWRRSGPTAAAALTTASLLPVLAVQLHLFPTNANVARWNLPSSLAAATAAFPERHGSTLQIGVPSGTRSLDGMWSELSFGNYARQLGQDYVNGYTPVGHRAFSSLLCISYYGSTCRGTYQQLFSREKVTGRTYADLMGLDHVVIQRARYPGLVGTPAPAGWRWGVPTRQTLVLDRIPAPAAGVGRVTAASGVSVARSTTGDTADRLVVSSLHGGTLVFARLAWPGYTAELAGRSLPVTGLDGVFVTVRVPAGTHDAPLVLTFVPPGFRAGLVLAALGATLLLALVAEGLLRRRPGRLRAPTRGPG